ncbi:NmrA domain-containing protein [Mycena chlorophos]|uniref:NmrA domain-containing protein n=1 Tax=Mycena chlorophos TaxID=658473 RepID=A0A8H6S6A1_MYCCL|nr:NmrA domain-containing protein [Mycena chlorophos]
MTSTTNEKKLILVIGATGAQGLAVIDALLSDTPAESPYIIRALTRSASNYRAKELAARGVELVEGSADDIDAVSKALQGVYGAFVNTNGFGGGEMKEIYLGMRIFEVAKSVPTLRHYIWSNLPHVSKNAGFDPAYRAEHMDAKGRVGDWLTMQESDAGTTGVAWSMITTGPYMDMLKGAMFRPAHTRPDGTVVFAAPLTPDSRVPLIALKDLAWWARYAFDHRAEVSGVDLNITSERVGWDQLVETYTKVTGRPAVFKRLELVEWLALFDPNVLAHPLGPPTSAGSKPTTLGENLERFWRVLRDNIVEKDMEWITKVHPGTYSLERWMREEGYTGLEENILKSGEDGGWNWKPDAEKVKGF